MASLKIRRDDEVVLIAGKDRGKTGKVLRVDPKKQRVYVEGLNIVKRHQRPTQVRDAQRAESVGGVIEKEGPIHISNVMLLDPRDKKPTRVGVVREGGVRNRVTRRSATKLD
jgi:large subunit ribosomal protein L24